MRVYDDEIYAFGLGATAGWLVTYLRLTQKQRLCKTIRKQIDYMGEWHHLSVREISGLLRSTSDTQLLELDSWAKGYAKSLQSRKPRIKISSHTIVAETIICEEAIGLTRDHGLRALARSKLINDLMDNLRQVVIELQHDEDFPIDYRKWESVDSRAPRRSEPRLPMVPR